MKVLGGADKCIALAAALTTRYNTYERYERGLIQDYLENNGVLLSMCLVIKLFPTPHFSCDLPRREKFISTSWVQGNQTGWSVFRPFYSVGVIIDPNATGEACWYPADAFSKNRDNDGCGPMQYSRNGSLGPDHMSRWRRLIEKEALIRYKNDRFGKDAKWLDTPCKVFLDFTYPQDNLTTVLENTDDCNVAVRNGSSFVVKLQSARYEAFLENLMGHPVCRSVDEEPILTDQIFLAYEGDCVWNSSDFSQMVDIMRYIKSKYPQARLWNEGVLPKPAKLSDIVQAVFYVVNNPNPAETPKFDIRQNALREATKFGKPLLQVDYMAATGSGGEVFTCDTPVMNDDHSLQQEAM